MCAITSGFLACFDTGTHCIDRPGWLGIFYVIQVGLNAVILLASASQVLGLERNVQEWPGVNLLLADVIILPS